MAIVRIIEQTAVTPSTDALEQRTPLLLRKILHLKFVFITVCNAQAMTNQDTQNTMILGVFSLNKIYIKLSNPNHLDSQLGNTVPHIRETPIIISVKGANKRKQIESLIGIETSSLNRRVH